MTRTESIAGIVGAVKEHKLNDATYVVTGKLYRSNKRFRDVYSSFEQAMMINLWNGSVYHVDPDTGKKTLLKRVKN